jgi:membrane-associated phospholipid phosphatase
VFWSGALHLAYLSYYVIIVIGPVVLLAQKRTGAARMVLFSTMLAFVFCYMWFILFPVAGPNWVFDHPTGPVREVWSARLVYSLLDTGSSYGAAFPSSHVAATLAATLTLLKVRKPLGLAVLGPCLLLIVATVYCQMHYGVDAGSGVVVGIAAVVSSRLPTLNRVLKKGFPAARVGSRPMDDGAV